MPINIIICFSDIFCGPMKFENLSAHGYQLSITESGPSRLKGTYLIPHQFSSFQALLLSEVMMSDVLTS